MAVIIKNNTNMKTNLHKIYVTGKKNAIKYLNYSKNARFFNFENEISKVDFL